MNISWRHSIRIRQIQLMFSVKNLESSFLLVWSCYMLLILVVQWKEFHFFRMINLTLSSIRQWNYGETWYKRLINGWYWTSELGNETIKSIMNIWFPVLLSRSQHIKPDDPFQTLTKAYSLKFTTKPIHNTTFTPTAQYFR